LHALSLLQRWHRWFLRHSAGALALLTLCLRCCSRLPWGLGQVGERLRLLMLSLLDDVNWADGRPG
jgi:hypothetical protein